MKLEDYEKELLLDVLLNARENYTALARLTEATSNDAVIIERMNKYRDKVIALHAKLYKEIRGREY